MYTHLLYVLLLLTAAGNSSGLVQYINIGGMFSVFEEEPAYDDVFPSALAYFKFAVDVVNNKRDGLFDYLLPNHTLCFAWCNVPYYQQGRAFECAQRLLSGSFCHVPAGTSDLCVGRQCTGVHVLIGPATSGSTKNVQYCAADAGTPHVSSTATSPVLSDDKLFPYFLRVIPTDGAQATMQASFIKYLGWECVTVVIGSDLYSSSGGAAFLASAGGVGISVTATVRTVESMLNATKVVDTLISVGCTLIVVWAQTPDIGSLLAAAWEVVGASFFQWVLPQECVAADDMQKDMSDTSFAAVMRGSISLLLDDSRADQRTTALLDDLWMKQAPTNGVNGSCLNTTDDEPGSTTYLYQGDHDADIATPNKCAGMDFRKSSSPVASMAFRYMFDAVLAVSHALHNLVNREGRKNPCTGLAYRSKSDARESPSSSCFSGTDLVNGIRATISMVSRGTLPSHTATGLSPV